MTENHYVILVHGTWNTPVDGQAHWAVLSDAGVPNFASELNAKLDELGLDRPIGRHANSLDTTFKWSGENTHNGRIQGAKSLYMLIDYIDRSDPIARIHIVAHSHGGNVALRALSEYLKTRYLRGVDFARNYERALAAGISQPLSWAWDNSPYPPQRFSQANTELAEIEDLYTKTDADGSARKLNPAFNAFTAGDIWLAGKGMNRIGRIVFLGTPFFEKVWARWKSNPLEWIGALVEAIFYTPIAALIAYVLWAISHGLLWVLLGFTFDLIPAPVLNPMRWSEWCWFSLAGISGAVSLFFAYIDREGRRSFNYYFNPSTGYRPLNWDRSTTLKSILEYKFQQSIPFPTLIIHSGMLDEVFMAMSTEPLVRGILIPRMREVFSLPDYRVATADGDLEPKFSPIQFAKYLPLTTLTLFVRPIRAVLVRYIGSIVLKALTSAGFGFPSVELREGNIMPSNRMVVPQWLRSWEWDVAQLLLSQNAKASTAEGDVLADGEENGFGYLFDQDLRSRRLAGSALWQRLRSDVADIVRNNRSLPAEQAREQLELVVLTIEQHVREIVNRVGLSHSRYYTNKMVIEAVARFLANGDLPPQAVPVEKQSVGS
jgi:hypothetical protein